MQATNQTTKARYLTLAAALTLLLNSGMAQTATPKTSDSTKPGEEETAIVLSPFVVDATRDQGYTATSTLAGSRINTELRDVAASITVVTKQFLKDVNAVNINDILTYTAGTEGTGDFTKTSDSLGRPSDDVSANGNTANRIRGLKAADTMRDYFYTIGTWVGLDSYNLDTVTINRGPNSVLAGLGSAAGIINYSLQMANLNKNTNQVTYRFGSYSDQRATFNTNYVAKKNVLAFRVAGAWSDKGYKQDPSWNKDKRLFGVVTYQPWQKTTIRLSHERVKIDSNVPNSITPEDAVSQWVALGKPTYDSSSSAPVSSRLSANGGVVVRYNKDGTIENAFNTTGTYTFYQQNLGNTPLWTAQRMNSNDYFQLDSVNLSPSLANLKYNATNLSIDQQILPGLYANLSYVKEKIKNDRLDLFRGEYMVYNIDVNAKNPDGTANSHFGETYLQYRGLDNKQLDDNNNRVLRGTLTYDLDLNKHNKWLGHHKMTAFAEDRKTETLHTQFDTWANTQPTDNEISYRYYLGGAATGPAMAGPQHPSAVSGVNNRYFDSTSGTYKTGTLNSYYKIKSETGTLEKLASQAIVLQSYFWEDKIVGMFGIRHDKDSRDFRGGPGGFATDSFDGKEGKDLATGKPFLPLSNTTKTYGVVVHPLKWLSFHYNHGENWEPNSGAVDLLGKTTPFPNGVSKDYGVSVRLLDDKLNVKLNWFDLSANDAASASANFPLAQWTIPWMDLTVMPDIAARAGITYKKGMADGLVTGDPRLANAYTEAAKSKGIELELTYNVTKDWRMMLNVSKQEASASGIAPGLTAFIEERLAYWKSIPALWTGTLSSPTLGWGNNRTGEQQWNADNLPYYIAYKANDGKPSPQLAKWHASVLTNYSFSDGGLKGFSIGGAARYIEKAVIGNPAILSSTGAVTGLDLAHPYTTPTRIALDVWAGYKMKICDGRYDLSFQFNIKDLQEGGSFRPINANGGDGRHSVFRIVQPRTFFLTTTLDF